jgi:hypothetical protein
MCRRLRRDGPWTLFAGPKKAFAKGMYQRIPDRWGTSRQPHHVPRLLIEDDHPTLVVSDYSVFRRAGFDVALCSGPSGSSKECPLLRGEICGLLEGADVVLHALPESAAVADAIRRSHRGMDMVTLNLHGSSPRVAAGSGATSSMRSRAVRRSPRAGTSATSPL